MAVITRPNGIAVKDDTEQQALLGALGLTFAHHPPPISPALASLLADHRLDPVRTDSILLDVEPVLGADFVGDVLALFPERVGLTELLNTFNRCHTHANDEARYILAGEAIYGFVLPNGDQFELLLTAGNLIGIPRGTEHWFHLTEPQTLVAVRLFTGSPNWQALYTGTPVQFAV